MKHKTLFAALAIALATLTAAAATTAAEPAAKPQRAAKATLDANGDGVIDRAEAAKSPRLVQHFDRIDRNGDGKLDASERPRHHGQRGHGKGRGMQHDHGRGRGMQHGHGGVERLDTDGDGRISRAEVEAGKTGKADQAGKTGKAGRGGHAQRLLASFDDIDANRDGYLVRGEVRSWRERQRTQREAEMRKRFDARFVEADLNRDGKLSRVEVDEKMPRLASRFAWMDENRDGFLDRSELQPRKR